ncbi:16S rRNA (cytidine(1402)-2'-O)-methyltransferase [Aestuariibius insulae]|uniref:16S rRNA (cytidine(1402)-2'-O)-methyltransferase n=1 Tax=Aestuariibius insulae TaxID=2058287 RepID=UPI00345E43C7
MNYGTRPLSAGLYLVATPIGTARDITLRALDVLATAHVIASEDTRTSRKLMDIHGIPLGDRPLVAYHDHSTDAVRQRLLSEIAAGRAVAYMSEAGTPLIADPGFALARAAAEEDLPVISVPGPSAVLAALTVGGLPTDRFFFAGFLPNTKTARHAALTELSPIPGTLVFYESPKRLNDMLTDARDALGADRQAAICRELTKKFEEVARGSLDDLVRQFADRSVKGEVVVLIDRPRHAAADPAEIEAALKDAMKTLRVKDAATLVAGSYGLPRREVYQAALRMEKDE